MTRLRPWLPIAVMCAVVLAAMALLVLVDALTS